MSKGSGVKGKTVRQLERSRAAAERQEKRYATTHDEQLAILDKRPGESVRERQRLARRDRSAQALLVKIFRNHDDESA